MGRECDCPTPQDAGKNRPGYCRICGGRISERWTSNDRTIQEFMDHLLSLPGVDPALIHQCVKRERTGREEFGHKFLARENEAEALEELADFVNYLLFRVLRARREGRPEKLEFVLQAAHHAALAYDITRRL